MEEVVKRIFRPFYVGALIVVGIGLFGSSPLSHSQADIWNKISTATVNESVIVGHKLFQSDALPSGTSSSPANRQAATVVGKGQ
jgi:hypothetical protein